MGVGAHPHLSKGPSETGGVGPQLLSWVEKEHRLDQEPAPTVLLSLWTPALYPVERLVLLIPAPHSRRKPAGPLPPALPMGDVLNTCFSQGNCTELGLFMSF